LPLPEALRLLVHFQCMPVLASGGEETLVGGQAVMEGVMMRAPHSYCVAVRKASGEIVSQGKPLPKMSEKYPIFRFPVLRGLGTLGQALGLGMRTLQYSANVALEELKPQAATKEMSSWMLWLNIGLALGFFIFMYKLVPLYLATALSKLFPALGGRIPFNLVDGVIRMAIFIGFMFLLSFWKDIRRVFEYHGAEHRVVFNFESDLPVTVENAQTFPTFHPRCGTSFLLVVMLVSIGVYTLLPFDSFLLKFAGRILLLPVIAGLSYELIRFAARHRGGLLSTLTAPGLWLQRITTRPPSADQTQVAIEALERAMAIEKAQGGQLVIA